MDENRTAIREFLAKDLVEVMIRVGLIVFLIFICVRIFAPFMGLMMWALILAVALYPLHQRLARRLGGGQGSAATVLVIAGLLLIGLPTVMLGSSFAGQVHDVYAAFSSNSVTIKPPAPEIAQWPLVGEKLYAVWSAAAADLPGYLETLQPQLGNFSRQALGIAAGTMGSVFLFLGALIVAGIMMTWGQSGSGAIRRILCRVAGQQEGPHLHALATGTVRSVATGVIGVAFMQALLLGVGFVGAGIPAAGVLAVVVMIMGILQLPAALISLPAIGYIWWSGDSSMVGAVVWSVYLLVAGLADNVLKPLLLGRGVDAPMPVILIGALGGMATGGIVGLFVGAVMLAVGYKILMGWVDQDESFDADAQNTGSDESGEPDPVSAS